MSDIIREIRDSLRIEGREFSYRDVMIIIQEVENHLKVGQAVMEGLVFSETVIREDFYNVTGRNPR